MILDPISGYLPNGNQSGRQRESCTQQRVALQPYSQQSRHGNSLCPSTDRWIKENVPCTRNRVLSSLDNAEDPAFVAT